MAIIRKVIEVTPVMATAGAYADGDQIGLGNTISNAAFDTGGTVELESVTLIDKAKQNAALDLFFFDETPTLVNADNGAFDMTDANMADQCIGTLKIAATDYCDAANSSVATVKNAGLFLKAAPATKNLFMVVVSNGTPTYANGSLVFKLGIVKGSNV